MKRTLRALALPSAILLLAACGTTNAPEEAPAADVEATEAPAADAPAASDGDESESWPIVEDEDGNVVENPEDEPAEGEGAELFSLTEEPFFASTTTGALITMTMAAQTESNEEIAWLEQYRQDAGGDPVTYILSDVDNRDGSELINMYNISLYDEDGTEYACESSEGYVEENWEPIWLYGSTDKDEYTSADGEPMDYEKAEELSNRINEHETTTGVDPFERGSMVSICPADLPEQVTAVQVMPGGIVLDPVYATPESYMGEDG